jgi:hypothetical protein
LRQLIDKAKHTPISTTSDSVKAYFGKFDAKRLSALKLNAVSMAVAVQSKLSTLVDTVELVIQDITNEVAVYRDQPITRENAEGFGLAVLPHTTDGSGNR